MLMGQNNHYGLVGVRYGLYQNPLIEKVQCSLFTHRNPKTGEVYGEDIVNLDENNKRCDGKWVRPEEVVWDFKVGSLLN